MEIALGMFNLVVGILIAFAGFRKINLLHNKPKEKQDEFYEKWGVLLKVFGIAMASVGFIRLLLLF